MTATASCLGFVERAIGGRAYFLQRALVTGAKRDSDTCAYADGMAENEYWRTNRADDFFRQRACRARTVDSGLHNGKFIATHAYDQIILSDGLLQSLGNHAQYFIADRVPQLVVYRLEVIEINVMKCKSVN